MNKHRVSVAIICVILAAQANAHYFVRVLGWRNAVTNYTIVSDQWLPEGSPNANAGTRTIGGSGSSGSSSSGSGLTRLVRFTVNPALKSVSISLLK